MALKNKGKLIKKFLLAIALISIVGIASAKSWGGYFSDGYYNLGVYYNDYKYGYCDTCFGDGFGTYYGYRPYNYESDYYYSSYYYRPYDYPAAYYSYPYEIYRGPNHYVYGASTRAYSYGNYPSSFVKVESKKPKAVFDRANEVETKPDDTRTAKQLGFDNFGTAFSRSNIVDKGRGFDVSAAAKANAVNNLYGSNTWKDLYN